MACILTDVFLQAAMTVAREAGELLVEHHRRPRTVRRKGRIDLVTETDLALEAFLKSRLAPFLPEAGFMAEESAASLTPSPLCWIIDPLDGTTNFAHGLPMAAVSVALWQESRVVFGVVNAPLLDEYYWAAEGRGAFLNGERLRVSETADLENALVATGFPYSIEADLPEVLARLRAVLPAAQGVRRCGAASLDLAWVAAGRFDAFYENRLKPWDVAAGWLLIREAGGLLTRFDGSPFSLADDEVLAGNGRVHQALGDLLRERIAFSN